MHTRGAHLLSINDHAAASALWAAQLAVMAMSCTALQGMSEALSMHCLSTTSNATAKGGVPECGAPGEAEQDGVATTGGRGLW